MKPSRILLSAALALLGAGCGGGQTGKVSVLLKDAPAGFSAAVVTISEVDLVGSEGTTVLTKNETTTDLLTLANDAVKLVGDAEVPVGTYSQLRFVITGAYVGVGGTIYATSPTYQGLPPNTDPSTVHALQAPSFAQSGLKIDLPGGAVNVGTQAHVLLVDFDVTQSFGQVAGASGMWVMHPVCQATEFELTGTIDVTLALGAGATLPGSTTLADFKALLTPADGSTPTTLALAASTSGSYGVSFLYKNPGTYTVSIVPPAGVSATIDPTSTTVTVTSGQAASAAFVVQAAAAITAQ